MSTDNKNWTVKIHPNLDNIKTFECTNNDLNIGFLWKQIHTLYPITKTLNINDCIIKTKNGIKIESTTKLQSMIESTKTPQIDIYLLTWHNAITTESIIERNETNNDMKQKEYFIFGDEKQKENEVIIIHVGSDNMHCGFSTNDKPIYTIPCIIGRPRHMGVMVGMGGGGSKLGFSVGGAKDINLFRKCILKTHAMPKESCITYIGCFYDYFFDTGNEDVSKEGEKKEEKEKQMFYPSYSWAKSKSINNNDENNEFEYFITCGLNSNILEKDFERNILNLVIVFDISGSMSMSFDGDCESMSKMSVAKDCLIGLLSHLKENDRFGLVLFDDKTIVFQDIMLIKDLDLNILKERIGKINTRGGTNFEVGYLKGRELIEKAIKMDNKMKRSNRIIYLTDMCPNMGITDKNGLFGLTEICVYKYNIYTTFIGMGIDFNTNLVSFITNLKGCN
eukprot:291204_1